MKPPTRRAPAPPPSLPTKPPVPPAATAAAVAAPLATAAAAAATAVPLHAPQPLDRSAGRQEVASSSGSGTHVVQKGRDSAVGAQGGEGKAAMGPPPAKPR